MFKFELEFERDSTPHHMAVLVTPRTLNHDITLTNTIKALWSVVRYANIYIVM